MCQKQTARRTHTLNNAFHENFIRARLKMKIFFLCSFVIVLFPIMAFATICACDNSMLLIVSDNCFDSQRHVCECQKVDNRAPHFAALSLQMWMSKKLNFKAANLLILMPKPLKISWTALFCWVGVELKIRAIKFLQHAVFPTNKLILKNFYNLKNAAKKLQRFPKIPTFFSHRILCLSFKNRF